ncbi:unnamed protein product [Owenia fusiformis]|uniref:Uncharacterized protein n=1 Tax=Owenia fusiformis TaxID=6347 RepID=A0A8J1TQK1_OWEFU|nr:unnamed protein product [Owenia fusiformis]
MSTQGYSTSGYEFDNMTTWSVRVDHATVATPTKDTQQAYNNQSQEYKPQQQGTYYTSEHINIGYNGDSNNANQDTESRDQQPDTGIINNYANYEKQGDSLSASYGQPVDSRQAQEQHYEGSKPVGYSQYNNQQQNTYQDNSYQKSANEVNSNDVGGQNADLNQGHGSNSHLTQTNVIIHESSINNTEVADSGEVSPPLKSLDVTANDKLWKRDVTAPGVSDSESDHSASSQDTMIMINTNDSPVIDSNNTQSHTSDVYQSSGVPYTSGYQSSIVSSSQSSYHSSEEMNNELNRSNLNKDEYINTDYKTTENSTSGVTKPGGITGSYSTGDNKQVPSTSLSESENSPVNMDYNSTSYTSQSLSTRHPQVAGYVNSGSSNSYQGGYTAANGGRTVQQGNSQYREDKQFSNYPNVQATPSSTPSKMNQTGSKSPAKNIGISPGKDSNKMDYYTRDSPSDKKSVSKSGSYAVRSTRGEYHSPQRDQTSVNTAMNESIESIKSGLKDGIPVNMVVIEPKLNTGILSYKGKYPDKPKKSVTWDLPETTRNVKPTLISKLFKSSGDKKSKNEDKGSGSPVASPSKSEPVTSLSSTTVKTTVAPPAIKTSHGYVAQHQIPSFKEMNQALKKSLDRKSESDTPEEFGIEGIKPLENTERDQAPVQIIHTKNQKPLDGISEPEDSDQNEADSVQTLDSVSQHTSNNTFGNKSNAKQPSGQINNPVSQPVEPKSPLKDWKPLNVGAIVGKSDQEVTHQNTTRVTFNEAPQGSNYTQVSMKENTPGQPVSNNKPEPAIKPKPPIISAKPAVKPKPILKQSGTSGKNQLTADGNQPANIENPAETFQHKVNSGSSGSKDQSINATTQQTTSTSTTINNTINVTQSNKGDINMDKSQYAYDDLPPPPQTWNESTIRYELNQGHDSSPQPQSMPTTPGPSTPGAPSYVTPTSPYNQGSYQYKGPEEDIPYPAYSFKEDLPNTGASYQSNSYTKSTPTYPEESKQPPQMQQQFPNKQQSQTDEPDAGAKRPQPSNAHPPSPVYKPSTNLTSAASKPSPTTPKPGLSAYERLMLNSPYAKKTSPQNKSSPPSTKPPSPLTTSPAPKAFPQGLSPNAPKAPAVSQGASPVYSGFKVQRSSGNYEKQDGVQSGNLSQPQYSNPSQGQPPQYTSPSQGQPPQSAYERTRPSSAMGNLVKHEPYNRSSPTIDQSNAHQGALQAPTQDRVRSASAMSNLIKQAPYSRSSPSIDSLSGRESPYSTSGDSRPPSALDNINKNAPYARSSPSLDSQQGDRDTPYGTVPYERNRPASASYASPPRGTLERHPSSASNTSGSTLTGSYIGMPEGQYNSMYDLPKHNTGEFNAPRSQSTIELPNTGDYGYNEKNRWSDMSYTSEMSLNYQDEQRGQKSQTPTPTPTETSSLSSDTSKVSSKADLTKHGKVDKNKDSKDPFVRGNKGRWSGKFRLSKRSKKKKAELAEKQAQMAAELEKRAKEKAEQQKPKDCEYQGFAFALDPTTGMMVIKAKEEPKPNPDNKGHVQSRNQSDRSEAGFQQSSQGMGPPQTNDNPLTINIPGQVNSAYQYPSAQQESVYEPVNTKAQTGGGGYDTVDSKQETKQQKPVASGGKLQDGMLVEERGVPEGASSSPGSSMDNVSVPSNSPLAATNTKQAQLDSYNKQIAEHLQYSNNKQPAGGKSQDVSANLNPPNVYHYGQPNTYHASSPKGQSPGYSPQQSSPSQYPVYGQGSSQYPAPGQGSSQYPVHNQGGSDPYSYTNQQGPYQYNNQGSGQYTDPRSHQYSAYQNKLPNQDKTQSELVGPYNTQARTNAPLESNQGTYRNSYGTYQAPGNTY